MRVIYFGISHLFSPLKWRILIPIMSKTLLKIVAYEQLVGPPLVRPTLYKEGGKTLEST